MKFFISSFKYLVVVVTMILISGCINQPSLEQVNQTKAKESVDTDKSEEYERTVSYQEIITKINDINTNKKTNKRVKEIVKEYRYNTSDDDSKNSAREKALTQVKIIILEEIGVFVESYLELNKIVADEKYHTQFKQEIKNLTAGIIKTKILDEKYDGKSYYVKASVLVDPDSVSEGISEVLKIKANQGEIKKLSVLLSSKEKEIDMRSNEMIELQKKIANQEFFNRAKEEELKTIQAQLQFAQQKLAQYQREEIRLQGELGQVQSKVNQAMQRIQNESQKACMLQQGMTKREVVSAVGKPSAATRIYLSIRDDCSSPYNNYSSMCQEWHYGRVTIYFDKSGLVTGGSGCR